MRHKVRKRSLNRTSSHLKSMLANMAVSLVQHEQIYTTLPKAKELRSYVEKLVTKARKNNLQAYRYILSKIKDRSAVSKLSDVLSKRYAARNGGYTKILKAGFRYGDNAAMAYVEFVDRDLDVKGKSFEEQKNIN